MKKILAMIIVTMGMALCLTGCGESEGKETTSADDGFVEIDESFKKITIIDCWGNPV